MAEPKVSQDMIDQINFLFQDKHEIQFFPRFSLEKHVSKQTQGSNPQPDLNLRLSLGGIYTKQNSLTRSSSVAGEVVNLKRNFIEPVDNTAPKSYLSLARSSSLPVEVERRERALNVEESGMVKRAEAKKRAKEKQRNAMKGTDKERSVMPPPCSPAAAAEFPAWAVASAAKHPALIRAIAKIREDLTIRKSQGRGAPSSSNLMKATFVNLEPEETESKNPAKKAKLPDDCIQDDGMVPTA